MAFKMDMIIRHLAVMTAALFFMLLCSCGKSASDVENQVDILEPDEAEILAMVPDDVPNTAFYKQIFLDGGCQLNPGIKENGRVINGRLPYALRDIGIPDSEIECFLSSVNDVDNGYRESDKEYQTAVISGNDMDANGILLYPDGEPRFRCIYVFGGHSGPHGQTLGAAGRLRVGQFYRAGGSYVGSCAGAYLAGKYASGNILSYFNILEGGNMISTGVSNSSIEIELTSGRLGEFGGPSDHAVVKNVRHNGGGYMDVDCVPDGTEVLARFLNRTGTNSSSARYYGQPAVWAYKASSESGRLVITGSHPEDAPEGDILALTSSMFRYAIDGSGTAKVKVVLRNGDLVPMTRRTSDKDPVYTAIGDLQCHHFALYLSKAVENLRIELSGERTSDLELYLKKGSFAFPEASPDFSMTGRDESKCLQTGKINPGLWMVCVRCATTVSAAPVALDATSGLGCRYVYSGRTDVLEGVPYTICASW